MSTKKQNTTKSRLEELKKQLESNSIENPVVLKANPEDLGIGEERFLPRETAFVFAYVLNGGNGSQAATTAGYSIKGSKQHAYAMLKKLKIRKAIDDLKIKIEESKLKTQFVTDEMIKLEILNLINDMKKEEKVPYATILNALLALKEFDKDNSLMLTKLENIEITIVNTDPNKNISDVDFTEIKYE